MELILLQKITGFLETLHASTRHDGMMKQSDYYCNCEAFLFKVLSTHDAQQPIGSVP